MGNGKVLIVEDNEDLARALELRLRANDYQIALAQDGVSAVAIANSQRPFAIVLDLHLSEEDGFVVMQEIHSSPGLAATPVIVVSADCSQPTQHRALAAGAHAFLEKPVNHRLLLHALRDIRMRSQKPEGGPVTACSNSR
ncbi:MAG: response regulator [Candidatus Sulfotelmatobacter sp.]